MVFPLRLRKEYMIAFNFAQGVLFERFGWAALSDRIGRDLTFRIFCVTGLGVYTSIPFIIDFIITNPGIPIHNFVYHKYFNHCLISCSIY